MFCVDGVGRWVGLGVVWTDVDGGYRCQRLGSGGGRVGARLWARLRRLRIVGLGWGGFGDDCCRGDVG